MITSFQFRTCHLSYQLSNAAARMGGEGDIMEEDEDAAAMAMTTTGTDRTRYTREERD